MKRPVYILLAAVTLAGCAKDQPTAMASASSDALVNLRSLEAAARIEEAKALQIIGAKLDAGGAAGYLMSKELKGGQTQVIQQQAPSILGLAWQSLLQVADIALRGYGIKANRDVAMTQSNNATTLGISSNGTFAALGGSIERAGTAGYPYVQAPAAAGPVTSYTISGSNGVNTGAGNQTYSPITSSYNQVNPNPTVVTCVGTPPVCTR